MIVWVAFEHGYEVCTILILNLNDLCLRIHFGWRRWCFLSELLLIQASSRTNCWWITHKLWLSLSIKMMILRLNYRFAKTKQPFWLLLTFLFNYHFMVCTRHGDPSLHTFAEITISNQSMYLGLFKMAIPSNIAKKAHFKREKNNDFTYISLIKHKHSLLFIGVVPSCNRDWSKCWVTFN